MHIVQEVGLWYEQARKLDAGQDGDFRHARWNLSEFVWRKANAHKLYVPFVGMADELCPHTLSEMYDCHTNDFLYRVSKDFCASTIYTSEWANVCFRMWHDLLHMEHHLDTTFEDEIEVGAHHVLETIVEFGSDSIEARLMYIDTILQSVCFYKHDRFPADQLGFAMDNLYEARYA